MSLAFFGCSKPKPTDLSVAGSNAYPTTISELTSIVIDGYANMRSQNLDGWGYLPSLSSTDHDISITGGMNLVDGNGKSPYNNAPPSEQWVTNTWNGLYGGVRDANSGLNAAQFYLANYAVAGDAASVKALRGESYFLRAYYYMQLEGLYGEKYIDIKEPASVDANVLGVPVYTAIPTTLAQTSAPRATARQVWNLITSDLDSAATLLPASWTGENIGRVTSWTAKGLLGKAYVFTQNWDSAKTVLLDVITNGTGPRGLPLQLMPFNIYKQAFNAPAYPGSLDSSVAQKFNQESLFEIEVERVGGNGGYGIFGVTPNPYLTSSMGLFLAPSAFRDNGDVTSYQGLGYGCGFVNDQNLTRFGFKVGPGYSLVDSLDQSSLITNQNFDDSANFKQRVSTTKVPGLWYQHISDSLRHNATGADPRLYVCAMEPFTDSVVCTFTGASNNRFKRPVSKTVNIVANAPLGKTVKGDGYLGWSFRKYQTIDAGIAIELQQSDGSNLYLLRLADIYLLYAEACMNTGATPTALEYINKVHRRAYNQPINSASPYDYATLTSPTIAGSTDVNLATNPLAYERHAELFGEGQWWFDICRWGNSTNSTSGGANNFNSDFGANEATYYGNLLPNQTPSLWSNVQSYSYPIPTTELNSNSRLAVQPNGGQNPNY